MSRTNVVIEATSIVIVFVESSISVSCSLSTEAGMWLLSTARALSHDVTEEKILHLQVKEEPLVWFAVYSLNYIWIQRSNGNKASLKNLKANMRCDLEELENTKLNNIPASLYHLISM